MRVFLYEHITGGGFMGQPLPPSLVSEGDLMLRALVNDLKAAPNTDVFIARDPRLPSLDTEVLEFPVISKAHAERLFNHGCAMADAVWPIAPESGGTLERLSTMVLKNDRILLGSQPNAVNVTASKTKTAHALEQAGVAVVPTYVDLAELPNTFRKVVIKPDDGAGCLNTRVLDRKVARQWWQTHEHQNDVVQPYVTGDALSLSLLCNGTSVQLLSCNRQQISVDKGELRFDGVSVNAIKANRDRDRYLNLAKRTTAAIPGLWGYVGVDLIETDHGPVIVEVNPRLTTSYVGLRRALNCNPAQMVLDLLDPTKQHRRPSGNDTVLVEAVHA